MEIKVVSLAIGYLGVRLLPFIYLVIFVLSKNKGMVNKKITTQKIIAIILGLCINTLTCAGLNAFFYREFRKEVFIEKIHSLLLYERDIQYLFISFAGHIVFAIVCGYLLRRFVYKSWSVGKKQESMAIAGVSLGLICVMLAFGTEEYFQSKIVINEICSDNESYTLDEEAVVEDYIEICNTGIFPCKIRGLFLSDDLYNLQKLPLEGYDIQAQGVLAIACTDVSNSFAINNEGETIYLSNENGKILEQIELSELESDTAYIRTADAEWEIGSCTPNMTNDAVTETLVEQPVLSHNSGFYDEEFELEISSSEDTIIFYTLDGSTPDEGSYIYEEPIEVYDRSGEPNIWKSKQNVVREWKEYEPSQNPTRKAFLVRAMAMDNEGNKSDVATATYFVGIDEYKEKDVISLVVEPEDLFGDEEGIYVTGKAYDEWYLNGQQGDEPLPNFRQKGREWEREAVFELFDNSESVFQQDVGVRIQGAAGRESALKRFSIYARKDYSGSNVFDYTFFENDVPSHSIVLREPVTDVICQELMEGRGLPYQRARKVYLFLNGELWYGSYLREKYSEQYFEEYYGIDEDNLIVIEGNGVGSGVETDMVYFNEFYRYIEGNDFSDDAMYQELGMKMDIQNYIDFLVTNLYCANMDIAFEKTKNVVMWRSRESEDGTYNDCKWRFALYDMDSMTWNSREFYGSEHRAEINSFSQQPEHATLPYNQTAFFVALKNNDDFCKQFVLSFMDIMNTYFSLDQVEEVLVKYEKSTVDWADGYMEKRPEYMKKYLAEEFGLIGTVEDVTLYNEDESKGTISINTVTPNMEKGSWTGEYFTDYPVTVTADPEDGFEFVGWSGSVVSQELTIEVPVSEGGIELRAEFQKIN